MSKTIEQKYQKKSQIEHILLRPDTYVGDISKQHEFMWIWDNSSNKIIKKDITYIPGLYKIFDEIIVNARDHSCNYDSCDTIKITINQSINQISVWNNGPGIDIIEHAEHKIYIPEMLFGELLTSTNYDDTEKRTTGGRNGYGAKLTNVFSKFFSVETVDSNRKLKYYQEFKNNLSERSKPVITSIKDKVSSYTKITFEPDLDKFKISNLTDDMIALMTKRVYDLAGVTNKIKVYLNDKKIDINNFKKYIELYNISDEENEEQESDNEETINQRSEILIIEETERWRCGIKYLPDGNYEQISFVNGICTYHGGNHVDYVLNQIIKKLEVLILKKYKEAKIKSSLIKDNLVIFLDTIIDNPTFTSQTKETLKSKPVDFGSTYEPSDKLIKKLVSTGIIDQIINLVKLKEETFLKKTDGKKTTSIKGIPKLEDANWAGDKKKSILCKLILTEGDSAKALAMAGRSVVGSDKYGIFPLKGKLLNVRDASPKQLLENEEIINIKKILGLQHNKEYTDLNELRYGGIILMCDQDTDGFHIKGLLMNCFHYFWPSLLKQKNFINALATPIVKATSNKSKKDIKIFYNLSEYENWRELAQSKNYSIKYYKGLGTSTKEEGREYFEDIENKLIKYNWDDETCDSIYNKVQTSTKNIYGVLNKYEDVCTESITLAFEKNRTNDRKMWLKNYDKNRILINEQKSVSISEFINKELIHFSNDDINRSIPSLVDGLKPSTRKILYGCILRKLFTAKDEIKVSQLSGFVSDKTCYHHGEASLNGAIVGMAQNFVGSNNINLLYPSGQFGTRLSGKDFASPRYTFTYLAELTRLIFRPEDDAILNYLNDDGTSVEPEYFCPIIPMVLINGAEGIGTGFSTFVSQYNPLTIIENIRLLMKGKTIDKLKPLIPYYKNFEGSIEEVKQNEYMIKGIYKRVKDDVIHITELPIGIWTTNYREFLEKKSEKIKNQPPLVENYKCNYTDEIIDFTISMNPTILDKLISNGQIWTKFRLIKSLKQSNMHLYDAQGKIKKYDTVLHILVEYYDIRLKMYSKRKEYLINKLEKELNILKWKKIFIEQVLDGSIIIYKQKKDSIIDKLIELKYPKLIDNSYDYLTNIPLFNLTLEKIEELNNKYDNKEKELEKLKLTTEIEQWNIELKEFEVEYNKWIIKKK
jgi:DNA topoisomerase-2